ncbi:MAG: winged helix-turn-helix domain-containing protein [Acidobacteria bacterium]|nr:winged helix-turn-helix domain-containing protein [Acidobacteriota bacterium]
MKEAKTSQDTVLYQFEGFRLEREERILWRDGVPIPLTPKAFETLLVLVENSGRVLTKEELLNRIWPDTKVEETTLAQNISTLRKALGPDGQQLIQTIPKRGYRFTVNVTAIQENGFASYAQGTALSEMQTQEYDAVAEAQTPTSQPETKKLLPYQLAIALSLIIVPLAFAYFAFFRQPAKTNPGITAPRTLAIMPFRNLKQEATTDFLGFSLADSIITKLGYVSSLTVRPSSYVDKYRDQNIDPKRVAVDLNINTLLTGTYIKEGDELRITAQLVDVVTNEILWKDALALKYENLMTVQDRVAEQVIRGLQLNLTSAEAERLKRDVPQNPLAYEYYLRGIDLYAINKLPQAIEMIEKSLAVDGNYALAWAHLGSAYTAKASVNLGGREDYAKAQQAYQKALALNPEQNEARISMATFLTDTNRVEQAVPLLREVLKTNPTLAQAHWELSYAYRFGGMLKESLEEVERARQLDTEVKANNSVPATYLYLGQYDAFLNKLPRTSSPYIGFYRGLGFYYQKDFSRATTEFNQAFEASRELLHTNIGKALSFVIAGQNQVGIAQLKETEKVIEARGVNDAEAIYKIAQAYAVLGDTAAALRVLRHSVEGGFFCYPYFTNDPLLDSLRKDKEFAVLLELARKRHEEFKRTFF